MPAREQTLCSECSRHFSAEAKFCPFDGTALTPCSAKPESDPLLKQVIDARYEVVRVLGEGGMGIVYEVRHVKLGRSLALKVLRSDLARDTNLCLRFIREARAAASVEHPGVVQITDFGALPSGQPYFVMELLAGQSLSQLLHRVRPLPLERMLSIVEQLVDALLAAHTASVVHRDLKPDNVQILSAPGGDLVKVLDFGLARVGGESRITKQGFVFGTPHYMSPEQAQGEPVDHRADIYALGVLMYEMATGKLPFDADSYMGVLTQHIHQTPERPSKLLGSKHLGAFESVILRCMEKKPERRFASLGAVAVELKSIVTRSPDGIVIAPRRARRFADVTRGLVLLWGRAPVKWAVGLAAAVLFGVIGSWFVSEPVAPESRAAGQRLGPKPVPVARKLTTASENTSMQAAGPDPSESRRAAEGSSPTEETAAVDSASAHPSTSLPSRARVTSTERPRGSAPTRVASPANPHAVPTAEIVDPWPSSESP